MGNDMVAVLVVVGETRSVVAIEVAAEGGCVNIDVTFVRITATTVATGTATVSTVNGQAAEQLECSRSIAAGARPASSTGSLSQSSVPNR